MLTAKLLEYTQKYTDEHAGYLTVCLCHINKEILATERLEMEHCYKGKVPVFVGTEMYTIEDIGKSLPTEKTYCSFRAILVPKQKELFKGELNFEI